ncbi:MAG: DUF885 family protein, partial [Woeseiaceae bacterium]|nr:DUF885 family protein [Woeseiaceae bacterium]
MKPLLATILVAALLLSACSADKPESSGPASADASTALATLLDEHFEHSLVLDPKKATQMGDYRYNDRLAITYSEEHRRTKRALDEEYLTRLLTINRGDLSYQEQLSYDMFRVLREQSLEGDLYPSHLQPVNQFYLMTNSFAQLGSGEGVHPFQSVKDYDDFLSRAN